VFPSSPYLFKKTGCSTISFKKCFQ
jgi:hypothetical protein